MFKLLVILYIIKELQLQSIKYIAQSKTKCKVTKYIDKLMQKLAKIS